QFKQDKTPPQHACSIALGFRTVSHVERDPVCLWSESQGRVFPIGPAGIGRETGYLVTILIGHLVIDVAGLLRPLNAKLNHGDRFVPLWPSLPGQSFQWPPQPEKRFSGVADNELI